MNFEMFFVDELLEALDAQSSEEFRLFFNDLEQGIVKALEHFEKWFLSWLHLPLVVCRLGGENAKSSASSFYHVALKKMGLSHQQTWSYNLQQNSKMI